MPINFLGGSLVLVHVPVTDREGRSRFEAVAGEQTSVLGLAVVPELTSCGDRYTGLWRVAHVQTGKYLGRPYGSLDGARTAAAQLADIGAHWERMTYWPLGQEDEINRRIGRALDPALTLAC